ncbi:LysE family translocator [Aliiruegeria lutimaris]|uniref:Threonine/homoserine/homoserine lactone efflux protein n=1 Tax=Aliiruegeria lutimaris TaxID=571298 RepID=A0A1G8N2V6_9RHOB|nr:LysE family translocator [Aliiruegeria lutimaris]SDI73910.1 Threonine/homoserine/homoserine lactone efflux protein [Aliiruegeria lutimaris]
MIPLDILSVFAVTSILLALAPGSDNIFVLTQSALFGWREGLLVTLGLCCGIIVHTTAVSLGVAAIFQASALAFSVLKTAGIAYLLYLAWGAFRAGAQDLGETVSPRLTARQLFTRGIVMNLTNPKVAIFFLAFLPQFTDPARGAIVPQMLLLGAVFVASAMPVFAAIALTAGRLGNWLRKSAHAQRMLNRVAGSIFVLLAGGLAVSSR